MRFIWFNLMPKPYLPDDFREKYRAVWVDIPSSLYDPVRGHEVYNTYLDQLEFAETVGYDGLGVNEHHTNAYGLNAVALPDGGSHVKQPCLKCALKSMGSERSTSFGRDRGFESGSLQR
jgi:hypothetical protein